MEKALNIGAWENESSNVKNEIVNSVKKAIVENTVNNSIDVPDDYWHENSLGDRVHRIYVEQNEVLIETKYDVNGFIEQPFDIMIDLAKTVNQVLFGIGLNDY